LATYDAGHLTTGSHTVFLSAAWKGSAVIERVLVSVARMNSVCHCGCPGGDHKRFGCTLCECRRFTRWVAEDDAMDTSVA